MKHFSSAICGFLFSLLLAAQSLVYAEPLFQVGAFGRFEQGDYEGPVTFKELKQHGNTGIGTVNGLDGEMIALDGKFYQIKDDGKAYPIDDGELTPFAAVTQFKSDRKLFVADIKNFEGLGKALDGFPLDPEGVYAFRIHADLEQIKVRSVPRQEKPYPTLAKALKNQTVFELTDTKGTLVGFRFPDYLKGVNVVGYHFHFITDDGTRGGHVLDCHIRSAEAEMQAVSSINMKLIPEN